MSKSMKRVQQALIGAGLKTVIVEMPAARTAQEAADSVGCHIDQIAKSIIFAGQFSGTALLFLTAGSNQVDKEKASALAQDPLIKADAALIRAQTGFAIGGVAPLGHVNPIRAWIDPRLMEFDQIWAAAGTPHHVFSISPVELAEVTGGKVADFTS